MRCFHFFFFKLFWLFSFRWMTSSVLSCFVWTIATWTQICWMGRGAESWWWSTNFHEEHPGTSWGENWVDLISGWFFIFLFYFLGSWATNSWTIFFASRKIWWQLTWSISYVFGRTRIHYLIIFLFINTRRAMSPTSVEATGNLYDW